MLFNSKALMAYWLCAVINTILAETSVLSSKSKPDSPFSWISRKIKSGFICSTSLTAFTIFEASPANIICGNDRDSKCNNQIISCFNNGESRICYFVQFYSYLTYVHINNKIKDTKKRKNKNKSEIDHFCALFYYF